MDYKEVLKGLLVGAYKLPDTEVDSLLNESADQAVTLTAILEKDSNRVSKIKEPFIGKFDQGKSAGTKAAMESLEKQIKEEYGIESDAQGIELVKEVLATKATTTVKSKELTEDDIKKTEVYQKAEKAFKKLLSDKDAEMTNKVTELENGFKKAQTFSTVSEKALDIWTKMNPVIDQNPVVAENRKKAFLRELEALEYQVNESGIVPMKDGKVVDDGHGNTMDFEKIVKDKASNWFEFKSNNGGSNGGNGQPGSNGGNSSGGANIQKPKTEDELAAIVSNKSLPLADRQKVMAAWESDHQNGSQN